MMNFAFDRDLFDEWAHLIAHGTLPEKEVIQHPVYFCAYVSRKNGYNYVHTHDEIMEAYGPKGTNVLVSYRPMPVIFSKVMGDYFYVYRVKTDQEAITIQQFIEDQHTQQ